MPAGDARALLTTYSKELRTMGEIPSWRRRRTRAALAAACGAVVLADTAAACGGSGGTTGGAGAGNGTVSAPTGGTPQSGGTATFALPPSNIPNYIFPFSSSTYFSVVNAENFQYLLYRPLYWFGNGASPTLNTSLSVANQPVYSGNNVTITLKDWKWSNGEPITADDVLFWIHMLQAVGSTDWGAFVPGGFPTNVSNVKATSTNTVTMTMNKSYNSTWFTYNELSQITPMPMAWDITAAAPSRSAPAPRSTPSSTASPSS
jgi:peptide/nickel transport system substrate-binding protein